MILKVQTRDQLKQVIQRGAGFLYNDFGSKEPDLNPVHSVSCRWSERMLDVRDGDLAVSKVWSEDLDELMGWLHAQNKPFKFCGSEPALRPPSQPAKPVDHAVRGRVKGTPRTYGHRSTEDVWRQAIVDGDWSSLSGLKLPFCSSVSLELRFRVCPFSPDYHNVVSPNGPDLDTMSIGTLDGLRTSRSGRPTLGLLESGGQCVLVQARKDLIADPGDAGVDVSVRRIERPTFKDFRPQVKPALSFGVASSALGASRKEAVKSAAEIANQSCAFRAPGNQRIGLAFFFDEAVTKNPMQLDWIEAALDGLGASQVGAHRFFDVPKKPKSEFGNDDSVVFWLVVARVPDLPKQMGLWIDVYDYPKPPAALFSMPSATPLGGPGDARPGRRARSG